MTSGELSRSTRSSQRSFINQSIVVQNPVPAIVGFTFVAADLRNASVRHDNPDHLVSFATTDAAEPQHAVLGKRPEGPIVGGGSAPDRSAHHQHRCPGSTAVPYRKPENGPYFTNVTDNRRGGAPLLWR